MFFSFWLVFGCAATVNRKSLPQKTSCLLSSLTEMKITGPSRRFWVQLSSLRQRYRRSKRLKKVGLLVRRVPSKAADEDHRVFLPAVSKIFEEEDFPRLVFEVDYAKLFPFEHLRRASV